MATQRGEEPEGRVEREGSRISESAGNEPEATGVCGASEEVSEGGCTSEVILCANVWYAWADERFEGSSDEEGVGSA